MLARTVDSSPPRDDRGQRSPTGTTSRKVLLAGAVLLNLVVLYAPDPGAPPGSGLGLDKVVHAGIFALLVFTGLRAGLAPRWFLPVVLAHAVISEIIQAAVLPHRAGDPTDALADAVGIALGYVLNRRWPGRRTISGTDVDAGR
jgi:hypothetical protein